MNRSRLSLIASLTSVTLIATAACTGDDSTDPGTLPAKDASTDTSSSGDAAKDTSTTADTSTGDGSASDDDAPSGNDASTTDAADTSTAADAADTSTPDAADSATPNFCATQTGLALCADFDTPSSFTIGASGTWESSAGTLAGDGGAGEIGVSTAQKVSAPASFLASLPGNTNERSAKLVKTVTPAGGVTQAIYEFDVYLATLPTGNGGFVTDLQFADGDQYGFRISAFANGAGAFDHANVEHNAQVISEGDDVNNPIGLSIGAWHHVKFTVAFGGSADAGFTAAFKAFIDNSATASVDKTYNAPAAKVSFARVALGEVFAFSDNASWGVYYDNVTLKLQ